jgi:peptidoglycan/LPS O-acetylase OafA/YrhL
MVLWSAAAILGLFALGTVWQRQQHPGRLQRVLDTGSDRSFGIFLIHPMILGWILNADGHWLGHHIINPFFSVLCYVLVVVFSIAATEVMRRSPLSLILTGRHQLGHSWRQGLAGRLKQDNRRETPETERSANATHDSSPTWTRDQTPA